MVKKTFGSSLSPATIYSSCGTHVFVTSIRIPQFLLLIFFVSDPARTCSFS